MIQAPWMEMDSLNLEKKKRVVRKTNGFIERLKSLINKEIHIKVEQDDIPVPYILKEVEKDFLIVDYGESQRIIPMNKIIFVQIGSYPKEQQ